MIKIFLATRYFYMDKKEGTGIGRTSYELKSRLEVCPDLQITSAETRGAGLVDYFKYSMFGLPLKIPKGMDVYHAITPIEGIYMPKDQTVVTFHDLFQITNPDLIGGGMGYNSIKKTIGTKYFELACRMSSRAKRVVCVSKKTKEEVKSILGVPEERLRVIPWGMPESLKPTEKPPSELTGPTFGYLGMLDKRKRVDTLVRAFHKSSVKATLYIAGRGLDEGLIVEMAERDPRIVFLGFIPENKLCEFYNLLDLFIFPTAIEGYGLPIVEALLCNKPVLVMEDSHIPEEVKKYCHKTFDLRTTFSIIDRNRGNLGVLANAISGSLEFAQSHSWTNCIDKYLEVYREVLSG